MKTKLPPTVLKLVNKFLQHHHQIFLVGGAVRDLLSKRPVHDWDFTTEATPTQILELFPKQSFYHNRFGTVGITLKKGQVFEVTTFRKEFQYSDQRHPDKIVWGKSIEEDLSRRDFTINAMALQFLKKGQQIKTKLIDPFDGQKDLQKKLIRAVGDPDQRFAEDALRMIRAVRLAAQLGFLIEDKTFRSLQKNAALIKKISWERIKDEFFKLLASPYPAEGLLLLYNAQILSLILPELVAARGVAQAKHHVDDVWTHSLKSLQSCPSPNPLVRLATLLHDIGKPATAEGEGEKRTFYNHEVVGAKMALVIGRRFRLSKKELEKLYRLVRWHQFTVDENQTDKAIRRFIRRVGKENLKDMLDLRIGDRLGGGARQTSWRLELFKKRLAEVQKQPFSLKDLKVNGHDVMRILQIKSGPLVGKILNQLFAEVEEDKELNQRKYLLQRIPQIARQLQKSSSST